MFSLVLSRSDPTPYPRVYMTKKKLNLPPGIFSYKKADGKTYYGTRLKFKTDEKGWRAKTRRGFITFEDAVEFSQKERQARRSKKYLDAGRIFPEMINPVRPVKGKRLPRNSKKIVDAWIGVDTPRKGVYFIQPSAGGLIKVGWTEDINKRFRQIQFGSSIPLQVLGVVHGGVDLEAGYHKRFINQRHHGEWFLPEGEVRHVLLRLGIKFIEPTFTYTRDWDPGMVKRLQEHFGKSL